MQTTWKITDADRDAAGNIKIESVAPVERSLADLLPKPAEIRQDAKRQTRTRAELASMAVVALIAVFVVAQALITPNTPIAPPVARPTAMLTLAQSPAATPAPTAIPVAEIAPNVLRAAVVAYDAPAGNVLGAIEQGRSYQLLARWGSAWLQADVAGSGAVWLKADQVLDVPAGLVDLEPPPETRVVERPIYVSAPPAPAEQAAPTPAMATAEPQLQTLIIPDDGEMSPALLREAMDR